MKIATRLVPKPLISRCSKPGMSPVGVTCTALQSVFDVALNAKSIPGGDGAALRRLYAFTSGTARCRAGLELSKKYGMETENTQLVVSITNKATMEQAWYNEARTRKPQTFKADAALVDPTDGGRQCDFCNWRTLTAEDPWGRIERAHAVTGSNLFKYGEPAHGLVLFKHHDPLSFSLEQLADFLAVSADWFAVAAAAHPHARHPFFIWNCGPRAGASQFHGHGQLMLATVPVPAQARLTQQAEAYLSSHPGTSLYHDLVRAHAAVGLARVVVRGTDRCWLVAHLAPQKDMEVLLLGHSLTSRAFIAALHAALRALVDGLGVQTFNCGILNVPLEQQQSTAPIDGSSEAGPAPGNGAEAGRRLAADSGGREAYGTMAAVECAETGDAALECACSDSEGLVMSDVLRLPPVNAGWRPTMARVVSRGKVTSPASDFGCLEVIGHASIGHTDPFVLIRMIDEQLAKGDL